MAVVSDWLFTSAIGIYMLAAFLYAAEYVLARRPVAAGRVALARRPMERLERLGLSLTVLGAGVHTASVVLRGLSVGRLPWGNMYEYLSAVGLAAVLTWLYVVRRYRPERVAVFVVLPVALLLFVAGNFLYTEAAELQPALRSYWIAIHVAAAVLASGVFLVSGVTSALHLVSEYRPERRIKLPQPEFLDRLAYRSGVFGFVTLTFAIITGAIWAEAAWGRFWGWDPKETVAFVSWVCYAAYLHARSTSGWRARRASWVNIMGLVIVLFNLFFVNLVAVGLHSYAGVQ
ncbi:c-type cytochrome biogenesis protein CcsB [Kibdelosporangium aridum]|uniref:C-type cytochrome biogenesis protein CcsB n=1 Tax=Kibdelosporangium aridum TaxID=2030 RepID=A0A428Z4W9_KIBAR|nr:c-type cytochrome biogenesis protein CcsB [Kibdelosporangium aridum]RSM81676.1 c-type cytochrome biogenesis protein CcsB [Kibdelosporangium aridum]